MESTAYVLPHHEAHLGDYMRVLTLSSAGIVTTIGITTTMTTMAYADPNNPTADENVHENIPGEFGGDHYDTSISDTAIYNDLLSAYLEPSQYRILY
ncbi:MAG TPA: hypothetical protein VKA91_05530 [Nitrososphaeraceae archaeon]|nr:hypothetical protein [Nitrososphaeraceae archaeon]